MHLKTTGKHPKLGTLKNNKYGASFLDLPQSIHSHIWAVLAWSSMGQSEITLEGTLSSWSFCIGQKKKEQYVNRSASLYYTLNFKSCSLIEGTEKETLRRKEGEHFTRNRRSIHTVISAGNGCTSVTTTAVSLCADVRCCVTEASRSHDP